MQPVILCVDDEKMVLDSLETQLDREFGPDFTVLIAESGVDALEILTECQTARTEVAVIIVDYLMPGMNGVRLLELVQQQFSATLKIMLTGRADLAAVVRAINQANLYRYIAKPWEKSDLLLTVREALTTYQMQRMIKTQHDELQALNQELEAKVNERTRELGVQKELFRQIFVNAPEAMALFDRETRIVEVNPAFERLFRYTGAALRDLRLQALVPPEWQADSEALVAAVLAGMTVRRETHRLKRDGDVIPVALLAYPITLGQQGAGGIAVYQDLTIQRQTEKIMRNSYQRRCRANLFTELAANRDADPYGYLNRARALGMDLRGAWTVGFLYPVLAKSSGVGDVVEEELERRTLLDEVDDWLSEQSDLYAWSYREGVGFVVRRSDEEHADVAAEKQIGQAVLRRLQARFSKTSLLLGLAAFQPEWENFGERCRQARSAVLIGMKLYPTREVHHYWDFGAYSVLAKFTNDTEIQCFLERTFGPLLRYDAANGTELFATLKQILTHENLRAAADALFIHYKTAVFRKRSIEKILCLSLDSFDGRTILATALVLYSLGELQDRL